MNPDQTIAVDASIGVCVKDLEQRVLHQNAECERLCGERRNQVCTDGCMAGYPKNRRFPALEEGIRSTQVRAARNGGVCESAVIHDGKRIVTLLYPVSRRGELDVILRSGVELSEREREVLSWVSGGVSNAEIARKLFISKATLRTHLNNIYKKLPADLRRTLSARRSRLR